MIPRSVSISITVFRHLMFVYPWQLRFQFGEEIADVFSQQIEEAWHQNALRGVAAAWFSVLRDHVSVTLPYAATRLMISTLAAVVSITLNIIALCAIHPTRCHVP
jgi:hypothetical protein